MFSTHRMAEQDRAFACACVAPVEGKTVIDQRAPEISGRQFFGHHT
jgi:hypothetical protein